MENLCNFKIKIQHMVEEQHQFFNLVHIVFGRTLIALY